MSFSQTARILSTLVVLGIAACGGAHYEGSSTGPAVTMPAHFAEGSRRGSENEPEPAAPSDGGVESGDLLPPPQGAQPDPEALREARQFEYQVAYEHGKLRVASVRAVRYPKPVVTARRMGRFAIELWIGHELVERVRFDFPLVAAEDVRRTKKRPLGELPTFAGGVEATQTVLVPASARATRAVLVDRATGQSQDLPWPPDAPLAPARAELPSPPADAGVLDDAAVLVTDSGPG